ncbi:MAG: LacI family transcriptional regulator [Chitinophagaceae bacterium]|nr:LacI family transcriptional regulator [Chitinophagaceae bacterium]
MKHEKEITIYDIAEKLKISAATVSRALSGKLTVHADTRKLISDAAKEMGYRSNNFASNLRKSTTHTIGVLLHELNSTFMITVLSGIEKIIAENDYDIFIVHSAESGVREVKNAQNLFHKRVDGVIASLAFDTPDISHFDAFKKKQIPVVFFDRVEEKSEGIKVIIDNYKAGYQATEHLIKEGCKRIAHITGYLSRNVYDQRYKGYVAALKKYKLPFAKSLVVVNDLKKESCQHAARQLMELQSPPDGLFVTNDFSAAICIQVFTAAGLLVPDDIAVVGFNNDTISTIIEPNLTTINYSGFAVGEKAAQLLIDMLNGNADVSANKTITLDSALIVRGSSLKKKA